MAGGLSNLGTIQNYGAEPYCSVAAFRAAPTWLDSDDLIPGGTQSAQDNELFNALLRSSSWCDLFTGGVTEFPYLGASAYTENLRTRSRHGALSLHPGKNPVQYVSQVYTGYDPLNLIAIPDITQLWIEDNRQVLVPVSGAAAFTGLQFGGGVPSQGTTFVELEYVAGYFNSTLAEGTYAQGTQVLSVNNPLGLIPGTAFRVNDPGMEEVVTVASGYTVGDATVPVVQNLLYTHTSGAVTSPADLVGVSALPLAVQLACIAYAVGLLMREDVSDSAPFGGSPGPAVRRGGGEASGLISEAEGMLEKFQRVR